MRSHVILLALLAVAPILVTGCAAIQDLENENNALRITADSLRRVNFECIQKTSALETRMDVMQKENLDLKDKAVRLAQQRLDEDASKKRMDMREAPIEQPKSKTPNYAQPVEANQSFQSLYQNALHEFKNRNYTQSMTQFAELAGTLPVTDLTDNCEYWIGECHYALLQYEDALEHFNTVMKYPGSDKLDDALMMRGNCFVRMNQLEKAKAEFHRLMQEFPESEYAPRAKDKLAQLQ